MDMPMPHRYFQLVSEHVLSTFLIYFRLSIDINLKYQTIFYMGKYATCIACLQTCNALILDIIQYTKLQQLLDTRTKFRCLLNSSPFIPLKQIDECH